MKNRWLAAKLQIFHYSGQHRVLIIVKNRVYIIILHEKGGLSRLFLCSRRLQHFHFQKKCWTNLRERYGQSGHDDAHHRHQFDEDVEARARGVLERVAYCIANDGGLVAG